MSAPTTSVHASYAAPGAAEDASAELFGECRPLQEKALLGSGSIGRGTCGNGLAELFESARGESPR
jgi:hypothetical protein